MKDNCVNYEAKKIELEMSDEAIEERRRQAELKYAYETNLASQPYEIGRDT